MFTWCPTGHRRAKENTREQQSHIAPKRGAAVPNVPGRTGHPFALQSPTDQRPWLCWFAPQNAAVSASVSDLRRPGASQQGGALYCACEHPSYGRNNSFTTFRLVPFAQNYSGCSPAKSWRYLNSTGVSAYHLQFRQVLPCDAKFAESC